MKYYELSMSHVQFIKLIKDLQEIKFDRLGPDKVDKYTEMEMIVHELTYNVHFGETWLYVQIDEEVYGTIYNQLMKYNNKVDCYMLNKKVVQE